jgi:uncharacterized protein YuzE
LKNELSRVCLVITELEEKEKSKATQGHFDENEMDDDLIIKLDELGEFVKSGNFRAEKIAGQLKERYSDNQLSELFHDLFLAVEDLDADEASNCINQIKKIIEGEK